MFMQRHLLIWTSRSDVFNTRTELVQHQQFLRDEVLMLRLPRCRIDVFDKAQAPYGLIFYGVAPDHVDMKKSMHNFERMFSDNRGRIELFCNVDVSRDIAYGELCTNYDAVVLAYGANRARRMDIQNENATNCLSGSAFVSWYNGAQLHGPAPLLDCEDVVIVGNGNVAIDCARLLLSSDARLAGTDITENALRALRQSRVRRVRVLGRRGPQNCSFTIKELRELLGLPGLHAHCVIPTEMHVRLEAELPQMERPRQRRAQADRVEDALRALSRAPPDSLECAALRVQCLLKLCRGDLAAKEVKRMQETDEDATITQLAQAWLNMAMGRDKLKDAFYIYQEMLDKYGATPLLLTSQAACLIMQQKYEEAEKLLLSAQERDPNNADVLVALFAVSQFLGKPMEMSNRYMNQLKQDHPTHRWTKDLLEKEQEFDRLAV
uniref:Coatomer subunit epsilon n=1 Tax=Globodera pallida TaxID=36090 RepID=A0A183C1A9_GLOPA